VPGQLLIIVQDGPPTMQGKHARGEATPAIVIRC
jgi:hypothetical protein